MSPYRMIHYRGNNTIWACSQRNIETRNHCCPGEAINVTFSECVFVALVIQHAMRMRQIILSWPVRLYRMFPHYLIQITIFVKTLLYIKCVF